MTLKAGSVADFANSLAADMEQAMRDEWLAAKNTPLPDAGEKDRRLLLVAIARGLFTFLKNHEDALALRITLREDNNLGTDETFRVTQLELNL